MATFADKYRDKVVTCPYIRYLFWPVLLRTHWTSPSRRVVGEPGGSYRLENFRRQSGMARCLRTAKKNERRSANMRLRANPSSPTA